MRAGIVGLGPMGLRHCTAILSLPRIELTALCDMQSEALQSALKEYPAARGYSDWKTMLAEHELDVLVIATNGPSHAEILIGAVEAGIGRILCEKPLATSLDDAKRIHVQCIQQGIRVGVNHSRRWMSAYRELAALLQSGVIGEVRAVWFTYGGGQLSCLGMHMFDLIRMLTGADPTRVIGFIDKTGTPNPRGLQFNDPGGYGMIELSNGGRLFFDESEDIGVPPILQIIGNVGWASVDEKRNEWRVFSRRPEDRDQPYTRRPSLYPVSVDGETIDLVECTRRALEQLIGDGPLYCTVEDGIMSLQTVIGVHISDRLGNTPVTLPLGPEWEALTFTFT